MPSYVGEDRKLDPKSRVGLWIVAFLTYVVGDTESTYLAIRHGRGIGEANPIMRPFFSRGRPWVYGIKIAVISGMYGLARRANTDPIHIPAQLTAWGVGFTTSNLFLAWISRRLP